MENIKAPVDPLERNGAAGTPAAAASLRPSLAARRYLRRVARSPVTVAAVVFAVYGLWLMAFFGNGHGLHELINMGGKFFYQSQASSVIAADPNPPAAGSIGYDGQFFYYLALDPGNARYYMDTNTYRYTRIGYPLTARLLALGRPDLIPLTLLLVNWLAIAGGVLALAAWLRRKGMSPWFAVVYGLFPGLYIALSRDLSEALAYGLVALGVYLFDFGPRYRLLLSAGVFALAGLTRETTVIFALGFAAAVLFQPGTAPDWRDRVRANWERALAFAGVAAAPLALYKLFLLLWLGAGHDPGILLARIPFQGLWYWRIFWDGPLEVEQIRSVVVPGLIAGVVAALALARRVWAAPVWLLAASVLLFVVFLQADAYAEIGASSRVSIAVVLSALLCLPYIGRRAAHRGWFWASSVLWLSLTPFWILLPAARYLLKF